MGKIRNKVALAGMGLLLAACGSTAAAAGTTTIKYPTRAVSLIVPVAAGSSLDIEARELAAILQQQFQWSIAVVDDPGASGAVGVAQVMSQPANGYTLLYEADGTMADLIAQKLIPYTFSDISPVVQFDGEAVGLITAANSPYKTRRRTRTRCRSRRRVRSDPTTRRSSRWRRTPGSRSSTSPPTAAPKPQPTR
jgi:putative tricarboxylic transport membrane protein